MVVAGPTKDRMPSDVRVDFAPARTRIRRFGYYRPLGRRGWTAVCAGALVAAGISWGWQFVEPDAAQRQQWREDSLACHRILEERFADASVTYDGSARRSGTAWTGNMTLQASGGPAQTLTYRCTVEQGTVTHLSVGTDVIVG